MGQELAWNLVKPTEITEFYIDFVKVVKLSNISQQLRILVNGA